MQKNKKYMVAAIVVFLLIGGSIYLFSTKEKSSFPAFEAARTSALETVFQASFYDLNENMQPLAQWQGKVLVVNFWATWCPPCLAEIPEFIRLQQQYGKQGVQFIGIAIDNKIKVQAFVKAMGMNYPVLQGNLTGADLSRQLGNTQGGLPYTVIIDRNGNIAATKLGAISHEKLKSIIEPLL